MILDNCMHVLTQSERSDPLLHHDNLRSDLCGEVLLKIAKSHGVKVIADADVKRLDPWERGGTFWIGNDIYIVIDMERDLEERRFTLAHEVAHVALNHLERFSEHEKYMMHIYEHEADTFALGILDVIPELAALVRRQEDIVRYVKYPGRTI